MFPHAHLKRLRLRADSPRPNLSDQRAVWLRGGRGRDGYKNVGRIVVAVGRMGEHVGVARRVADGLVCL
jgi:hypothetical protein